MTTILTDYLWGVIALVGPIRGGSGVTVLKEII
jgi:hypothetical protein